MRFTLISRRIRVTNTVKKPTKATFKPSRSMVSSLSFANFLKIKGGEVKGIISQGAISLEIQRDMEYDNFMPDVKILTFLFLLSTFGGFMLAHTTDYIQLPEPSKSGKMTLEEALYLRRSVREFSDKPLNLNELSQLLWASQGKVKSGRRSAPSAGALYPLEIYVVCGNVKGLSPAVYRYDLKKHSLHKVVDGDKRGPLASAALGQYWVRNAPVSIVITAVFERTTRKYGERGIRYVFMEVGHVGQNILLQAVAIKLGAVPVGAFYDEEVKRVLNISENEQPLYIISVGREKQ